MIPSNEIKTELEVTFKAFLHYVYRSCLCHTQPYTLTQTYSTGLQRYNLKMCLLPSQPQTVIWPHTVLTRVSRGRHVCVYVYVCLDKHVKQVLGRYFFPSSDTFTISNCALCSFFFLSHFLSDRLDSSGWLAQLTPTAVHVFISACDGEHDTGWSQSGSCV